MTEGWLMMKFKSVLILFSAIFIIVGCEQQTKYVCLDGSTVSDASLCQKEEKSQQISFSLGAFNPVWATYSGYKCEHGKLTIQANTLYSLEGIQLPSNAYFDCHFKVGDYTKENILPNVNTNIGGFDTSNGYSITLCCKAKTSEGKEISEEYCKTEYLEP